MIVFSVVHFSFSIGRNAIEQSSKNLPTKTSRLQPVAELVGRVQRSRNAQKRWAQCEVLVIDEISMMEAALFDKLNAVGQR